MLVLAMTPLGSGQKPPIIQKLFQHIPYLHAIPSTKSPPIQDQTAQNSKGFGHY
jgi:hypothetical protein